MVEDVLTDCTSAGTRVHATARNGGGNCLFLKGFASGLFPHARACGLIEA